MPELAAWFFVSLPRPLFLQCFQADPRSAVWFKVHQDGLRSGGTWGATPLMAANNAGYKFTIPQCLAPGSYLVRHELVALHAAWAYPGAQFYPSCFQVRVTGSGTARPSGLVSFPGAYKATDPGVVFDVYRGGELLVFHI
jgi:AA9 family protein